MSKDVGWAIFLFFLLLPVKTSAQVGKSLVGVPANFGSLPGDVVFSYGAQYLDTPRHAGTSSTSVVLPGSLSYVIFSRWSARVDASTLKSVDQSGSPRGTGPGDMDIGTTFVLAPESSWPGATFDYQLNIPTGSAAEKLGAGHYGHRFTFGATKALSQRWGLQYSAGDLVVKNSQADGHDNAFFTAASVTYRFPAKDLTSAVPTLKNEFDFIPAYDNKPTESYDVLTFSLPLKWRIKMNLQGRAGITPYAPKWGAMVQFQYLLYRRKICVGCLPEGTS